MRERSIEALGLAGAALGVGLASSMGTGARMDAGLFRFLNANRGRLSDRALAGVTELGSIFASIGAAGALASTGHRRVAARALGAAGVMWGLGQILKKRFLRARPYEAAPDTTRLLIGKPRGASWPSSHPAVLLTFLTVAERDLGLTRPVRRGLGVIVGVVGLSRVHLGVHYPSDVVGGILLGRAVGLAWPFRSNPGL